MNQSYNLQQNLKKAAAAYRAGNLPNATDICQEILNRYPEHAEAHHLLGIVVHQAGNHKEAARLIQLAIKHNPTAAPYYYNLGNAWYSQRLYAKAGTAYDKAIKLQPINPEAWNRLGLCRQHQYDSTAARRAYLQALQQQPNYTTALNNLGLLCFAEKDYRNAGNLFRKTLQLDPQHTKACHNLAISLQNLGNVDEAIVYYKKTLKLNPELPGARRQLIKLLQSTCSWPALTQALSDLDKNTTSSLQKHHPPEESPFLHLTHSLDSNRNLSIAQSWSTALSEPIDPIKKLLPKLSTDNIIKIGYLSCDYQDHPVAHNMLNLFRLHDRNQFHISAYSCGSDDGSDYRKRISQDSDVFVDLQKMSNQACAKRIQADGIHILVELMGHTSKERLGICAFKPAPIQVSYLAYPGTTGAQFIDYLITDEIVIPPEDKPYYSETIIYLPDCFMVADRAPIGPRPQRLNCGLPENGFIFCSFNTAFKIEPIMFKVWMDILRATPQSSLWLREGNNRYEENLQQEAHKQDIDPKRLIFAPKVPQKQDHLARLQLADLALDTRIYNGHTTTLDALWAGVPVITTKGNHFASRVSDSNLSAIGLPEMVVSNLASYQKTAVKLAQNPEKLRKLRDQLDENRLTTPLFNTAATVKNLEAAYRKIWQRL